MKRMQPYARIVEANNMPLLIPSGPFSRTHSHTPNKAGKVHWDSYRPELKKLLLTAGAAMDATTSHQKKQKHLQKSYSQYNLSHLDSSAGESSSSKKRKHLGGVYGLLARHIDVPQHLMDKAQEMAEGRPPTFFSRRSLLGLPMLHPYSRVSVAWRAAMLVFDLTFTAFWVPLNIGFCYSNYGNLAAPCTQSDLAGGIVYVSNWLMGFLMGAVLSNGSKRAVCVDGRLVTYAYVAYGKFAMDLLASIPFFVLVGTIASGGGSGETRLLSLLSLLRLVRMLRLVNTVKVVYQDSLSGHYRMSFITRTVSVSAMYLLLLGFQFAVVVNMCASLMIMLAAFYGYENTWQDSLGWWWGSWEDLQPLTTTGAGQAPRQAGEQVVSNFCSVYGMVFNGLVVGVVGRALMQATGDASNLYLSRKKVGLVSSWADTRHLPPSVKKELQVYFADSELARGEFGFEAGVIEGLPTTLRRQVVAYVVRPLVDKVHILSAAEHELRDLIATMFRPLDVPPGHDLCRQGHLADRLWLVEWGTVVALRHKEQEAHPTTGMTCLLGEGVLLRGVMDVAAVRPWTLRTSSACRLWELAWEDLEPLLRVYPRLQSIALQYIKDRLIRALDGIPQRDTAWCELVAVLSRILKQPAQLDQARDNLEALEQSREEDGSLPALLSSWLEAGISTTLELGATGAQKRGLVTMSIMLARQSKDALGAPSTALGLAAQSVGLGMLLPGGTTAATLQREPSAGAPGLTGFGGGMGSGSGLGASSVELPTPVEAEGEEDVHAPVQAQRLWQGGARSGHVRFFRSFSLAAGNPGIAAVSVGAAAADADSSHLMDRLRAARERANSLSRRRALEAGAAVVAAPPVRASGPPRGASGVALADGSSRGPSHASTHAAGLGAAHVWLGTVAYVCVLLGHEALTSGVAHGQQRKQREWVVALLRVSLSVLYPTCAPGLARTLGLGSGFLAGGQGEVCFVVSCSGWWSGGNTPSALISSVVMNLLCNDAACAALGSSPQLRQHVAVAARQLSVVHGIIAAPGPFGGGILLPAMSAVAPVPGAAEPAATAATLLAAAGLSSGNSSIGVWASEAGVAAAADAAASGAAGARASAGRPAALDLVAWNDWGLPAPLLPSAPAVAAQVAASGAAVTTGLGEEAATEFVWPGCWAVVSFVQASVPRGWRDKHSGLLCRMGAATGIRGGSSRVMLHNKYQLARGPGVRASTVACLNGTRKCKRRVHWRSEDRIRELQQSARVRAAQTPSASEAGPSSSRTGAPTAQGQVESGGDAAVGDEELEGLLPRLVLPPPPDHDLLQYVAKAVLLGLLGLVWWDALLILKAATLQLA
eukprot:XP_001697446.1 predicted protein [Chlamydomonas reinhardtii]